MDQTDELIDLARSLAEDVVDLAGVLLRSGADLTRIHREYVVSALELLAEAETQALLSSAGDRAARKILESTVVQLERLQSEATDERDRYADGDFE